MENLIYITPYHVLILHLFALLKFMWIFSQEDSRLKKEGQKFSFKDYFSDQWDNWAVHYLSMWALMLILPNLVEFSGDWIPAMKSVKDSTSLTTLGTATVGFFGFDAVQYILDKFKTKTEVKP
jgi:uncharacterized membrane protein